MQFLTSRLLPTTLLVALFVSIPQLLIANDDDQYGAYQNATTEHDSEDSENSYQNTSTENGFDDDWQNQNETDIGEDEMDGVQNYNSDDYNGYGYGYGYDGDEFSED